MAPWPDAVPASGVTMSWNGFSFQPTSISYQRSAAGEIDCTGIDDEQVKDKKNTGRFLIKKRVDFGVIDPGELTIEFVGPPSLNESQIGLKDTLRVSAAKGLDNCPDNVKAILTSVSAQAQAGELVRGSATFRLTDS